MLLRWWRCWGVFLCNGMLSLWVRCSRGFMSMMLCCGCVIFSLGRCVCMILWIILSVDFYGKFLSWRLFLWCWLMRLIRLILNFLMICCVSWIVWSFMFMRCSSWCGCVIGLLLLLLVIMRKSCWMCFCVVVFFIIFGFLIGRWWSVL